MEAFVRSALTKSKDHTLQFAIKDWWISDFIAMYNHEPASLTVECITDSTVIEFNAQKLLRYIFNFQNLNRFKEKPWKGMLLVCIKES